MAKRLNVLRSTIVFDIEVDPTSTDSVNAAIGKVNEVRSWAAKHAAPGCELRTTTNFLRTTTTDGAPAGQIPAPGLDIPDPPTTQQHKASE